MLHRAACLVTGMMIALTPFARAQEAVALPDGFDGTYAVEGMTCRNAIGRVSLSDGVMVGAEFAITVTDLVEFPGEPDRISATLWNEGGGGAWEDSAEIVRLTDGLQFTYPDGSRVVWPRCD